MSKKRAATKPEISSEEAAAVLQAAFDEQTEIEEVHKKHRVKAAQAEIAAVCEKHRVVLVPSYQFIGGEMRGDVLIQAR